MDNAILTADKKSMYFVYRGGGQTPNLNSLDFILVELLNLVMEKFNPILALNFKGVGSEKLKTKYILSFFFIDDLPKGPLKETLFNLLLFSFIKTVYHKNVQS